MSGNLFEDPTFRRPLTVEPVWPDDDPGPAEPPPGADSADTVISDSSTLHENRVQFELENLRVRDDARRLLALEANSVADIPPPVSLTELLAQADDTATYRLEGLWPTGGRVLLAAQFKAGKTTLVSNLMRSLVDSEPFLGRFVVTPVTRIALIDDEMDARQLRRQLRDQGIVNTDAITVVCLRGRVSAFDLLDAECRARWAQMLAGVDVLIVDCLRPILDSLGLDESREAGRFLVALDELLREAGISEALLVHHMGHSGERSRGDSRLLDWPDVLWKIVRDATEDDAPQADRYFSAYGRDVDVREGKLDYTPSDRSLVFVDTSRKESAGRAAVPDLVEILQGADEGLSGRALAAALTQRGHPQKVARQAVKIALDDKTTYTVEGPRNAKIHHLNPSSVSVRHSALPVRQHGQSECVSVSIETHSHSLPAEEGSVRYDALAACSVCGREMLAPSSIDRGMCERCHLDAEQEAVS